MANDAQGFSRVLEGARRKLLDTGTRNRLVHVNRANARANCLNVINEQPDPVFEILRRNGRRTCCWRCPNPTASNRIPPGPISPTPTA
jgi:hypothetical protein